MPQNKESDDRLRIWLMRLWIIVGAVILTGVVVYLLQILSIPVSILIWTVIIIFCLRGIVNGLSKRMKRIWATTLAYVIMFVLVALFLVLMFSPIFGLNTQFLDMMNNLPDYINSFTNWLQELYQRFRPIFEDSTIKDFISQIQNSLGTWASDIAQSSAQGLVSLGTGIVNSFIAIGFALVIAFWILLELPGIGREFSRIIGPTHSNDMQFFHTTLTKVMGGYIRGTLLQCAIIGVVCGIIFAIMGLPNAAALGAITGVINIIPVVGPWIAGIFIGIVALFSSIWKAVIAIIAIIIVQQFVYTFISPKIMANSCNVHPVITLLSLMIGSAIGGAMDGVLGSLIGMLFSIPFAAVAKAAFIYYFEKKTGRVVIGPDGVFFKGYLLPDESVDNPDPLHAATDSQINPDTEDSGKMDRVWSIFRDDERKIVKDLEKHVHVERPHEEKPKDEDKQNPDDKDTKDGDEVSKNNEDE